MRWLFLLISLLSAVLIAPSLALSGNPDWRVQAGGGLGLLWLGVWWTHGYAFRGSSLAARVFDGIALLLVGEAIGDPSRAIGLFYAGLAYRSLDASPGRLVVAILAYYGAFLGASALGPDVSGGLSTVALLGHAAGFVQTAAAAHFLARILSRHGRATDRERILARAEASLLAAPSRDRLYSAAIEAALALAGSGPDIRVAVTAAVEARMRHRSGTWIHTETIANNLLDDPSVGGLVLNTRDVGEQKALADQLMHQAYHDPLTGLPNRALFRDRLEAALARADGRAQSIAILFLDLDNFKVVNDSLGHEIGDQLLVAVAGRLRSCVRPQDTVARLGGDEFTILIDIADVSDAINAAKWIGERLRGVFSLGGREAFASASIGIAFSTPTHDRPEHLLRDADVALYRAKSAGKARYEVFDQSMGIHAWERLALETGLRRALERDELLVYYQPVVDLRTGAISGVEALVRWHHPQRGLISPAAFIPLAEENGLILGIGRWVLEEACRRASEWQARHPTEPPLMMSVNLSARQLQDSALIDDVRHILEQTGLDPCQLKLEITESAAMEDLESTVATLHELQAAGIGLAMDDFGTGYSSLSYLKRFPIDTLKIDRSFVKGFGASSDDTAIVRAVVAFAQSLNLRITAEGVETAEQLVQLRAAGCDHGQGYYFAQPRPWEEVSALLDTIQTKLQQSGGANPWLQTPAAAAS